MNRRVMIMVINDLEEMLLIVSSLFMCSWLNDNCISYFIGKESTRYLDKQIDRPIVEGA